MQIPGFEILEKLGEGGMATVWKARQLSLDRIVAIKILSLPLSQDKADAERFLKEAQAMAALKHPGIIQVYDANVHEGVYYFVMEYVAGYSVGDWIRRKKRISEGDALLTADYVADALHYAWKTQRMIHCDIKPDNIMIDEDGTIKVADLGLSKTIGISGAGEESDEVMGTPNYMSPEQVMGDSALDCRADIYSLGAMLYHMLTGKLLFQEYGDSEAMKQQVNGHVPDPLDLNPDLSMGTCWMIEKMLAKDKNHRQTDWDGVLSDIPRVLKGKLPAGSVLPAGVSTVIRSKKRNRLRGKRVARIGGEIRQTRPLRTATFAWMPVLATAFVVTLIAGLLFWLEPWKKISYVVSPPLELPVAPVVDLRIAKSEAAYKSALAWSETHPDDCDGAMQLFEKVVADFARTRSATMALSKIDQLKSVKDGAVTEMLASLVEKTAGLVKAKRFDEAEAIVRDYSGKFAGETGEKRKRIEQ
ncbi:MAG: serine/threonine-protein kinase, partial [bacterium]